MNKGFGASVSGAGNGFGASAEGLGSGFRSAASGIRGGKGASGVGGGIGKAVSKRVGSLGYNPASDISRRDAIAEGVKQLGIAGTESQTWNSREMHPNWP